MSTSEEIFLIACDGQRFQVLKVVMLQSQVIKHVIEDVVGADTIPIPNVNSNILSRVIEYSKKQDEWKKKWGDGWEFEIMADASKGEECKKEVKEWNKHFVDIDQAVLFDLILAADYLNIPSLLDLTLQKAADNFFKGKTPDEILMTLLDKKGDWTPEEENVK